MAAFTLGFPEIEKQLRLVRQRRTTFALQHALYTVGGSLALLAALLIFVALRGQTALFRLGLAAAMVSDITVAGRRIKKVRVTKVPEHDPHPGSDNGVR
jgi:hypothetical protein